MFNAKSKKTFDETSTGANTIIGAGTVITGNIASKGDIRIDGTLVGNLTAKARILIGPEGSVDGDIEGMQADILGKVIGDVRVKDLLNLRGKALLEGNIYTGKLQIEPTATFNGQCHMGANIVELNAEKASVVNQ
ncbi:MAG: polymer-forming cytoskeletal protein [Chitinophagaceae bacterium]|nr:polymer-forming cytoskeletal protein [Chitinophagaceae bacterium]MBL0057334.1 polymer-forming cytoskeletal protein [Chitinophagaceae bacterium]